MSKNTMIVFNPLNTIYTYDFSYTQRTNHQSKFKSFSSEEIKTHLTILPYIIDDVFKKYTELGLISCFRYFVSDESEKEIINSEHNALELDKYFKCEFITKQDIEKNDSDKIIFISEEVNDFKDLTSKLNVAKIANWMIYKEDEEYLNYQKRTIPLLSSKNNPLLYDLIIECFRQSTNLILHLFNSNSSNLKEEISQYFLKAINVIYILDTDSTAKLYRKRELAQSNQLVKYHPFLNKRFPTEDDLSLYPKIDVFLQRCPYYYFKNKEYYLKNIQRVVDLHKDIVQLHPIKIVDQLFDRYEVIEILSNFINENAKDIKELGVNIKTPLTFKYILDEKGTSKDNFDALLKLLEEKQLAFPFIIKPTSCTKHEMQLILNKEGLEKIFSNNVYQDFLLPNKTFVLQELIPHGGEMIKNYSINEESYSFIRPSLPDIKGNVLENKALEGGSLSFYNEMIYQKKIKGFFDSENKDEKERLKNKFEKVDKISLLFVQKTGITLYGLDFLYDSAKDIFYILEVNYFPSYRELGEKFPQKFSEHMVRYYKKFLNK